MTNLGKPITQRLLRVGEIDELVAMAVLVVQLRLMKAKVEIVITII